MLEKADTDLLVNTVGVGDESEAGFGRSALDLCTRRRKKIGGWNKGVPHPQGDAARRYWTANSINGLYQQAEATMS